MSRRPYAGRRAGATGCDESSGAPTKGVGGNSPSGRFPIVGRSPRLASCFSGAYSGDPRSAHAGKAHQVKPRRAGASARERVWESRSFPAFSVCIRRITRGGLAHPFFPFHLLSEAAPPLRFLQGWELSSLRPSFHHDTGPVPHSSRSLRRVRFKMFQLRTDQSHPFVINLTYFPDPVLRQSPLIWAAHWCVRPRRRPSELPNLCLCDL